MNLFNAVVVRRFAAPFVTTVIVVLAVLVPILTNNLYWQSQVLLIALWSLAAIALNFLVGYTGELAIVQLSVFAVGAYTTAILMTNYGWSFWPASVIGGVIGGISGMVVGAPGLRVAGWYLAIMSLFTVLVLPDLIQTNPGGLTGGFSGIAGVPLPSLFGHQMNTTDIELFCVILVVLSLLFLRNLNWSSWGGAFALLKRGPAAARSVGINIYRTKLLVYFLSSLLAGYAGAIYPQINGAVGPSSFPFSQAVLLLAGPVLGGLGCLLSPVVGVAVLLLIPVLFNALQQYALLIYGLVLILVVVLLPDGVIPALESLTHWVYRMIRGRPLPPAPRKLVTAKDGKAWVLDDDRDPITLTARNIHKQFGGNVALADVSLDGAPGRITAVIGPNGSGKTTLLNILSGMYKPDSGRVFIADHDITGKSPDWIARRGLGRTFQTPYIPGDQTVTEIIAAGAFARARASVISSLLGLPKSRRVRRASHAEANAIAAHLGLASREFTPGGELTAGEQRLTEIGRALMTHSPILLLDEPAAGLVGEEVSALMAVLRDLRSHGYTVIVVEHHMELIMGVSDEVIVLDQGSVLARGDVHTVSRNESVISAYLGVRAVEAPGDVEVM